MGDNSFTRITDRSYGIFVGIVVVHPLTRKAHQLVTDIEQQLSREVGLKELEGEIQALELRSFLLNICGIEARKVRQIKEIILSLKDR